MATIRKEQFGTTKVGEKVVRYTLENQAGMSVTVLNYGCIIQNIYVPDKNGRIVDVVLGYDDLKGYEIGTCHFGTFVGRYANRIKGAAFELNGKTYTLEKNNGRNHLHGIYCSQVFEGFIEGDTLIFRRVSPDGEEGYPGTLTYEVRYFLREDNALEIEYRAATDADTVINFTNHSYFNLNGDGEPVLDHKMVLKAGSFTEGDAETLPTGRIMSVEGTPMDFRKGKRIGTDIKSNYGQIVLCRGYDHNYILDTNGDILKNFAEVTGDISGITMKAYTTQPGVQFYTGNNVHNDAAPCGKGAVRYPQYGGFCLETQHYPCSPNFPAFPSTILRPGDEYIEKTIYKFCR